MADEANSLAHVAALIQRLHQAIEQVGDALDFGILNAELARSYDTVLAELVDQCDRPRSTTRFGQDIRYNPPSQSAIPDQPTERVAYKTIEINR